MSGVGGSVFGVIRNVGGIGGDDATNNNGVIDPAGNETQSDVGMGSNA